MTGVTIAEAGRGDLASWARLRDLLWPGEERAHRAAIAAALERADPERLTLLAFADGEPVGMAEAAVRHDYVNGCDTSPVAFLEGIYVAQAWRRKGVARRLIEQLAAWGRAKGIGEFASDASIDNADSHRLHRSLGFEETERIVFFRRSLAG